jgi:outer membrane protein OmpA-like peptidoglycan-associated protein
LQLDGGVLRLSGAATHQWIQVAKRTALAMPGVASVETTDIRDLDRDFYDYVEKLKHEPGIVVTAAEQVGDKYVVSGLLDPLATPPEAIRQTANIDPRQVTEHWEPYQSFDPQFTIRRLEQALQAPATVQLRLEGDVLHISGAASHPWIVQSTLVAKTAAGVSDVNVTELTDIDLQTIERLKSNVRNQCVYFESGTTDYLPDAQEAISTLADNLRQLFATARIVGKRYHVRILGHAAPAGIGENLQQVSTLRAERLKQSLVELGISSELLEATGMGSSQPASVGDRDDDLAANRRATIEIIDLD